MLIFGTGLNSTLKDQIMSHPALHDALNDPKNGDSATKHLKQQVCLGQSNYTKIGLLFICQKLTFFLNIVLNEILFSLSCREWNLSI